MYVYAVICCLHVACCSGRRTNCLIYAFFYSFSCVTKVRITVHATFGLLRIQNSLHIQQRAHWYAIVILCF